MCHQILSPLKKVIITELLVLVVTRALACQDVLTAEQLRKINRYNWHSSCLTRLPVSLKLNYYHN